MKPLVPALVVLALGSPIAAQQRPRPASVRPWTGASLDDVGPFLLSPASRDAPLAVGLVSPDTPDLPPRRDVATAMRAIAPLMRACGDQGGFAALTFVFGSDGRTLSVTVHPPLANTRVGRCLQRAAASVSLPSFRRATFTITFPFALADAATTRPPLHAAGGADGVTPDRNPHEASVRPPWEPPDLPAHSDVAAAMRRVGPAVRACGTGQGGTATVTLVFDSLGNVTTARVHRPPADTPVGSCVVRAARGAHLPPFTRPTFSVTFPFALD